MYEELLEKANGRYSEDSLCQLETIEKEFSFTSFKDEDMLRLGNILVEKSAKYGNGIAVMIIREKDSLPVFQYVSCECTEKNLHYAKMKYSTAVRTRHNSLWALAAKSIGHEVVDVFDKDTDSLPVGGAWPVIVGDELIATIALSGLPDGNDYRLLVDALSSFFECNVQEFDGMII